MAFITFRWIRRIFRVLNESVYLNSRQMRSFYAQSDELVERHFGEIVSKDLNSWFRGEHTSKTDVWNW